MKKIFAVLAVVIMLAVTVCIATAASESDGQNAGAQTEYFRIHVRANSNSQIDQNVKYAVKDKVVEFLTPYVAGCDTKENALEVIGGILADVERVCDKVLSDEGFGYTSRARIKAENFPTRVYGDVTLEAGIYDALIIELGTGEGDNWWCVIYPPLCFTSGSANVKYRSAIYDIIKKFFA